MKPMRSPARRCPHRTIGPGAASVRRAAFAVAAMRHLKCLRTKYFCSAAAAESRCRGAGATVLHALSGSDRQYRADQECRSGRARAGLSAIDQLQGRRLREGRHHAVHDRARDLQAEARTGAGRGSRRAGIGEAGRGGLQAPAGTGAAAGRFPGDAGYIPPRRATTRRRTCCRPRSTPRSRRSITAIPMWPRRSTASSARISSPSANSSARRRRRSLPPSWRSIRSM